MRLLRYDLPRQVAIAFIASVGVVALIGWLIAVLDQIDPDSIVRAEVRGSREGEIDGYEAAFERGRLDGAGQARLDLAELLDEGDPGEAYRRAYDFAWNEALDTALEQAKRDKLEVESAFPRWEALRR